MTKRAEMVRSLLSQAAGVVGTLSESANRIAVAAGVLTQALKGGHKVLICGNGGSAADSQHMAAELVGRFVSERKGLPAISLTADTSAITAIANDYGYEQVFSRQVEALGNQDDVLVVFSTSGRSANVVQAVRAASAKGLKIISLVGGGEIHEIIQELSWVVIRVKSDVTARIQECHTLIFHIICEMIDVELSHVEFLPVSGLVHTASAMQQSRPSKVHTLEKATAWRVARDARGAEVAWVNGAFDLLHPGHLSLFRAAKGSLDARLSRSVIVGVNSDESIRLYKGRHRPVVPLKDRLRCLEDLSTVDMIVVFDGPDASEMLLALEPDVVVKGSDYKFNVNAREAKAVLGYGGKFEFVEREPEHSTSQLIKRAQEEDNG